MTQNYNNLHYSSVYSDKETGKSTELKFLKEFIKLFNAKLIFISIKTNQI